MKAVYWFDLSNYFKRWGFYAMLLLLVAFALLAGAKARFSLSDDLLVNSPYQLSFLMGFLSLFSMFFSTVFSAQLLFREADARFELVLFSTPLTEKQLVAGRFLALFSLTLFCLLLLTVFFFIGQASTYTVENAGTFRLCHYLPGFLWFMVVNAFFTTAISATVGWLTRNKLIVYVSGLFLYMVYMLSLLFSGSPFMAQSMPQTEQARLISAIADPFGLSAFFYQTSSWLVEERNTQFMAAQGLFLYNRLAIVVVSALLVLWNARRFSFARPVKGRHKKNEDRSTEEKRPGAYRQVVSSYQGWPVLRAFFSFAKINLTGMLKSTPFLLTALVMLFHTGMELYAEIEKGIRIPQQYASSGLMTETILQNFHGLCIIVVLYYTHDLFWKSRLVNFYLMEESTALAKTRFCAQWFSLGIMITMLACLEIMEGILFQLLYHYPLIEWNVYATVFLFNVWPLILLSGFVLLIQRWTNQRYVGLILSAGFALLVATPLGKILLSFPLGKFMQTTRLSYSGMNGFGPYQSWYVWRLVFGSALILLLFILSAYRKKYGLIVVFFLSGICLFTGITVMKEYIPEDEQSVQEAMVQYERHYRKYENLAQPQVTHVSTAIDLFPDEQAYHITGLYVLENKNDSSIQTILLNFPEELKLHQARLLCGNEVIILKDKCQLIHLKQALLPGQKAKLEFTMSYAWKPVNGHQSFNAIIENGSFMRISRYYPRLGYLADKELSDEALRRKFRLGAPTPMKAVDAPPSLNTDFIELEMILSTKADQAVIGIGELVRQWQQGGRHYAHYKPSTPVPFRFALSSAEYAVKKENYKGKAFEIWYHPLHKENVAHLMANAKQTMDYCEANFGPYPFSTVRFAEVSAFTRGFAATAYPATIFMTEDLVFHANINADEQQDVINELAGHELSHLWWGNSQIAPDERDGAVMLTETFAMYTELMLLKKMYGEAKAKERVLMHLGIYNSEKGFSQERPLYKVRGEQTHISYSKGAVVMWRLSKLIGEEKVNLALKHFLEKYKYPHPYKPVSTDFIRELYYVCDTSFHAQIGELFKGTKEIREEDL
jgi:ABC-2 type transport system permease protein